MANITLSIPDDVYKKMKKMKEFRWSEIARQAIIERINDFEVMESIAKKSKLTKKDVEELSKKIKKSAAKRFNEISNN